MSPVQTVTRCGIGHGLTILTQGRRLPLAGLRIGRPDSPKNAVACLALSLARSYGLWRLLVRLGSKGTG